MKIAFLSTYSDIQSIGVRVLTACLRQAGHAVRAVYLLRRSHAASVDDAVLRKDYDAGIIAQLVELCRDAGLIACSSMTEDVFRVRYLIQALRPAVQRPVVWGGVHPTLHPEECLAYADYVCVGEGEQALPALVRALASGEPAAATAIPGIWSRRDGHLVANGVAPMVEPLDAVPFPDYSLDDAYVLDAERIEPLTPDLLRKYILKETYDIRGGGTYGVISSRGCPYGCT